MIRFAMPWLFGAGVFGALAITALHFLSVRRPPELLLPTARFLDEGQVRAVSRSAQPSDLLLLVLRVLALLLACAAIAGPQWVGGEGGTVNLVVADARYRADSLAVLALIDSTRRNNATSFVWRGDVSDSTASARGAPADLAAALPIAVRAATALVAERPQVDSIALYVYAGPGSAVSSAGWRAWRERWPGGVHLLERSPTTRARNESAPDTAATSVTFERATADDPVRAAFASRVPARGPGSRDSQRELLVMRGTTLTASSDSGAAALATPRADAGGVNDSARGERVSIVWPENGVADGWEPVADTVTGVGARGITMVGNWARTSRPTAAVLTAATPIAWWSDGTPAATERAIAEGCVRDVAIAVPPASDMLLDASARGLMQALLGPCMAGAFAATTIPTFIRIDSLDRTDGRAAASSAFQRTDLPKTMSTPHWLAPALLALALLLLLAEWALRDRSQRGAAAGAATTGSAPMGSRS